MKKVISVLAIAMALVFSGITAEAAPKKKTAAKGKKKTTAVLPVTKGETKQYGDYLTTQMFTIKKGKECGLEIEYPVDGNPQLVNAIRKYIKNRVDEKFTGSLETPEQLMRSAMKDKRDVSFGEEGESMKDAIKVVYASPTIITLEGSGDSYMGGAHGYFWDTGSTFLVKDGKEFDSSMFPSINSFRSKILQGIATANDATVSDVKDWLFSADDIDYPATVLITDEGIVLLYQPYEVAPFAEGIVKGVIEPTPDIINSLTPSGREFFEN